jgi:eukaryotic-like serine/threonine-protein kinase
LTGRQLAQRYTLSDEMAPGALCRIIRGADSILRRPVVVKAIPPAQVEVYMEAMRATSGLTHPAAIALYDAIHENGWLLLVQEAIQGQALSRYLRQGVPSQRAVNLALQLAQALAYTHYRDIVHGDLTPTAVLVDRQATIRINNHGLPPDLDYFLTEGGEEIQAIIAEGTPYGDVLALGLLLRQLLSNSDLTGDGQGARQLRSEVPVDLAQLVTRCSTPGADGAITEMATLAIALEEVGAHLAETQKSHSTDTPAALRVAREFANEQALWSSEQTVAEARVPLHALERGSHELGSHFTMITDPGHSDIAATRAAHESDLAVAPRLSLPTRPPMEPPRYPETAGPARPYHADESERTKGLALGAVLVVGALLFIIFFLIGYLGPFTLSGR